MKLLKYLILCLVHCLIITSSDSKCQRSISCGHVNLTVLFAEIWKPDCGLFTVHGCNSIGDPPKVRLEAVALLYHLLHEQPRMPEFCPRDTASVKLSHEGSCFLRYVSLHTSPLYSLTLDSDNLTMLVRENNTSCYGKIFKKSDPFRPYDVDMGDCVTATDKYCYSEFSRIQVHNATHDPLADLFKCLIPIFTQELNVSNCSFRRHCEGVKCLNNSTNELHCKKDFSSEDSRLPLILAASGGGLALLLCLLLVFYIIQLRRRIINMSYLYSRKMSLGPSPSEIDGGSFLFGIPIFTYMDLEAATNSFDPSKIIGDGGFGTVYHGKLRDGTEVAIKRLYEQNCRRVEQFINEIKILTSLRHPNLVSLYGCTSRRSRELLLVYEYIPNGTVADHLHGDRAKEAPLTWPTRMRIAMQTAEALSYLHKSDIIHCDVKTDNILLDKNFNVKVADFGLSKLFPYDASHISTAPGGTPGYIDPNYHQCYQVTDKSDVYSFGVVLIELISSMPAVDISRQTHEINLANFAVTRIQRCAFDELIDPSLGYNFDAEVTSMTTSVAEIAFRCLQLEKEMRPSMGEVLAFLRDI